MPIWESDSAVHGLMFVFLVWWILVFWIGEFDGMYTYITMFKPYRIIPGKHRALEVFWVHDERYVLRSTLIAAVKRLLS